MKIKQLLCLLVLAVSGNTFGSNANAMAQTSMDMNQTAMKHFQHNDISIEQPAMKQMMEMDNKHMTHPDLAKKHIQLIQEAHNAGRNEAYMKIGTYMQPAMNAMATHVTAAKK